MLEQRENPIAIWHIKKKSSKIVINEPPFLRHGFDKGNSTREAARCGAHPLQAFFVDSISTQEAESSHLRGV